MEWSKLVSRNLLILGSVLLLIGRCGQAQTGTSAVGGTVTDAQGRAVAGAKVTLKSVATNAARSVESTNNGTYLFDLITPGGYRIEVEANGFNKTVVDNVQALIGKQTETNVQLSVGQISQTVEVRASLSDALINTQDASLGNVFDSNQISQLPLEGRNVVDLLSLQPGATHEGYVTGSRADQSEYSGHWNGSTCSFHVTLESQQSLETHERGTRRVHGTTRTNKPAAFTGASISKDTSAP